MAKKVSFELESLPAYFLHPSDAFWCPWRILSKHSRKMHENFVTDFM